MFSQPQYDALRSRAGIIDRSGRGRLVLTGADRRSYLQGLLTNDIAALDGGRGCHAALLTPQGRMVSDMRVSELGDRTLIDLPAAGSEPVRQRLADFIFSEDVVVHDVRAEQSQIGVYGPDAAGVLERALEGSPSPEPEDAPRLAEIGVNANVQRRFRGHPAVVVGSDDFGVQGFELFVSTAAVDELVPALRAAGAVDVDAATADVLRVEAGRPEFGIDMDEHTIPLEAGIEDRAISLTKGCYVGQEIVIRVLHRGHGRVAKRLVGLVADAGDASVGRGARLHAGGKEIGVVTSVAHSPKLGRTIALGYVQRDYVEPGVRLQAAGTAGAVPVSVAALPFSAPAGG